MISQTSSPIRTFLFTLTVLVSFTLNAQWEYVGDSDNYFMPSGSISMIQNLEFNPLTGEPYVFFRQHIQNVATGPSLVKYNGVEWEEVSLLFDEMDLTTSGLFGFYFRSGTDIPVVCYQNSFWNPEAGVVQNSSRVVERIGTEWYEIIGVDNVPFDTYYFGCHNMRMVQNPVSTDPVLIGDSEVTGLYGSSTLVTHYNNDVWEYLGDDDFGDVRGDYYDMDYSPITGQPYVITYDGYVKDEPIACEVFVYNGSWQSLGNPPLFPVPLDEWKVRASTINEDIYVMTTELFDNPENSQTRALRVCKWDGSTWTILGEPEELWLTSALGYDLEIHPETGEPYVAFIDGNSTTGGINIRRWDGSNWVNLADENPTYSLGELIDMEFQPGTNYPYVTSTGGHLLRFVPLADNVEENEASTVQLYPNPVQNLLNFSERCDVVIFDQLGKKIIASFGVTQLETTNLSPGLYMVHITDHHGQTTTKELIKQ